MYRTCLAIVLCVSCFLLAADEWWGFTAPEDTYKDSALLDLRRLNEKESGESGFIRIDKSGTGFVRGDGAPIRFWGVASNPNPKWSPNEIREHFRFLAKRGVNFVRMHCHIADESKGAKITDVDRKELDTIFHYVAAAKENGIYLLISPYWYHRKIPTSWGLAGYKNGDMPVASLYWNEKYQAAYREWTRVLYATVNPYTKLAIKDDPTVAMLKMKNEDGLFWWSSLSDRIPEPQLQLLRRRYAKWATAEYGSVATAQKAWRTRLKKDNDNELDFYNVYQMTLPNQGGKRMADQIRFLAELQRGFYAGIVQYLKEELQCQQITASMSWRSADKLLLEDTERWTYTANDVVTQNIYFSAVHKGKNRIWRIDPGDCFVPVSAVRQPWLLPTNIKQPANQPTVITEIAWTVPNRYQSEGPILTAAYQCLTGVAISCWFHPTAPAWDKSPFYPFGKKKNGWLNKKKDLSGPMAIGMFPAAALIWRQGLVADGKTVVHEERKLSELWQREEPIIAEGNVFDPLQDAVDKRDEYKGGRVSRLAFLTGRVEVKVNKGKVDKDMVADLSPYIDVRNKTINGSNGQIHMEYGKELCRVNAPSAQAAIGFLGKQGPIKLHDVTIDCKNEYATVAVVAMDGKPLSQSRNVLIQLGTISRPTGWKTEPATFNITKKQKHKGLRIVNSGHAPIRVQTAQCTIDLANTQLSKATALDVNGYPIGAVQVEKTTTGLRLQFPPNSIYCIME